MSNISAYHHLNRLELVVPGFKVIVGKHVAKLMRTISTTPNLELLLITPFFLKVIKKFLN